MKIASICSSVMICGGEIIKVSPAERMRLPDQRDAPRAVEQASILIDVERGEPRGAGAAAVAMTGRFGRLRNRPRLRRRPSTCRPLARP